MPNSSKASLNSSNITRAASVIACTATGFTCYLSDIEATVQVMEASNNTSTPASGPAPGAATVVVEAASVIACAATGLEVTQEEVEKSLLTLEESANDEQTVPSVPLDKEEEDKKELVGSRKDEADKTDSGTIGSEERPEADGAVAVIAASGTPRSRRIQPNVTGSTTNSTLTTLVLPLRTRHTRHSEIAIADGNVIKVMTTSRSARSNSFRSKRDASKLKSERGKNAPSSAIPLSAGAAENADTSTPSLSPRPTTTHSRSTRSTSGSSGDSGASTAVAPSSTIGSSDAVVPSSSSNTAPRTTGSKSVAKKRSATDSTSYIVRSQDTTKITVRHAGNIPITTTEIFSNTSTTSTRDAPIRPSKTKRSARTNSTAIPLPAGTTGRITRSYTSAMSAIPLPPGPVPKVTVCTATVTSLAMEEETANTGETKPTNEEQSKPTSTPNTEPVTSKNEEESAPLGSDTVEMVIDETSANTESSANITYPSGVISSSAPIAEQTEEPEEGMTLPTEDIAGRPVNPVTPMPAAAAPVSTDETASAPHLSTNGDGLASPAPADLENECFF